MSKILYASITNVTKPISVRITHSHGSATSVAVVEAESFTGSINDLIEIYLGYEGDYDKVFYGYVKQIDRSVKPNTYTITAHDVLVRAADYFIASSDPENPLKVSQISAEDLIALLLSEAGLTDFDATPTTFEFYPDGGDLEINLVSSYDFCNTVTDIIAWSMWADINGTVFLRNRKPYPMTVDSIENLQPGYVADTPYLTLQRGQILNASFQRTEKDTRNRIVVYGRNGIHAEASEESCFLPAGLYKSVVLSSEIVDTQEIAQKSADYNLTLLHRLTKVGNLTVEGDPTLMARKVVTLNATEIHSEFTGNWYIYSVDHSWSKEGYTCDLDLRSFEIC